MGVTPVGAEVWLAVLVSCQRPEPKNQMWSFQRNPPSVASYRGSTCWTRVSPAGETADQASFVRVVRNEPEKRLPPDFVIVLTMPPVNRPNSAETDDTVVVVS